MTIDWSAFVPGLLLLLYPADRLLPSMVELRSFESFQTLENSPRQRPWWWVPVLWLDPMRGLAGTLLLKHAFAIGPIDETFFSLLAFSAMTGLLGLAVLSQVFTRREEGVLLAPIGFVIGLVAALIPWSIALIGFTMAGAGLFAFRSFPAFFGVGLTAIAGLGFALKTSPAWLAVTVGVLGLPILASLLTGSRLELPTHKATRPTLAPPSSA